MFAFNSLAVILVIAGLVLAWPLSALFRRIRHRRQLWFRGSFFALFLIGQALIIFSAEAIVGEYARKNWPTTTGIIIRSDIIGERAYRPNIVYQYELEGRQHVDSSSLDPASFGGRNARYNTAKTIAAEYQVGDSLTIWVNPKDHTETTLTDHVFWAEYVKISFGFMLILVGLAGLFAGFRSKPLV